MREGRKGDLLAVAVLLILPTILFADVLFVGNNLFSRDLATYHYPMKKVVAEAMRAGVLPHWNPLYSAGQPMAANPAYEMFYPPQWITLIGDFNLGFRLHILFHLYAAGLGMYLLLRSMRLAPASALFGSVCFSLGGGCLSVLDLLPFLFSLTWLPYVCLFTRRFVKGGRKGDAALAAVFGGLQLLVCEPTLLIQTYLLLLLYAFWNGFRSGEDWRRFLRPFSRVVLVLCGSLLVGAVQFFPALDFSGDSIRARGFPFWVVSYWSMPLIRPMELFFPKLLGSMENDGAFWWGYRLYAGSRGPFLASLYVGLLAPIMAMAGCIRKRSGWLLFLSALGVSLLLALGGHTPLLALAFKAGIFPSIRYPEKFILMGLFSLIVFSSKCLDEMRSGDVELARTAAWTAAATALVALLFVLGTLVPSHTAAFGRFWVIPEGRVGFNAGLDRLNWIVAFVRGTVASLLLWRVSRNARDSRRWIPLALFIAADILPMSSEIVPRVPRRYFDAPQALNLVMSPRGRLFSEAALRRGDAIDTVVTGPSRYWFLRNALIPMMPGAWNVPMVLERDVDETQLRTTRDFLDVTRFVLTRGNDDAMNVLMRMSGVRYRTRLRDLRKEHRNGDEVENIVPVDVDTIAGAAESYFADSLRPAVTPENFARSVLTGSISRDTAFVPFQPFAPAAGQVMGVRNFTDRRIMDVHSEGQAVLVMSISSHQYWNATLDGRKVELWPANLAYQAILVPPGRHRIELFYRNPWIGPCMVVTSLGLLAALGLIAMDLRIVKSPQRRIS